MKMKKAYICQKKTRWIIHFHKIGCILYPGNIFIVFAKKTYSQQWSCVQMSLVHTIVGWDYSLLNWQGRLKLILQDICSRVIFEGSSMVKVGIMVGHRVQDGVQLDPCPREVSFVILPYSSCNCKINNNIHRFYRNKFQFLISWVLLKVW